MSADEAIARLIDGETIHTMTPNLIGADWTRAHAELFLRTACKIEESGPMAAGTGHGLWAMSPAGVTRFFETRGEPTNPKA
jgi:hypothetical protein